MLPLPWACMARTSCFMLSTTPRTLVSNVAAKLSAVWSRNWADRTFGGGVVHRDIETAKPCEGFIDHGADVILLANIGVDELGLRTERAQLFNERLAGLITPTGNDHVGTLLGESDGGGATDAGGAAGDQDDWEVAHILILAICSALPREHGPNGSSGSASETADEAHACCC